MLEKREQFITKKMDKETEQARAYMKQKNKTAALQCLQRKKTYESQCEEIAGARMTIDEQAMALESANASLGVVRAMKMGASSMKTIHKDMCVACCWSGAWCGR